MNAQLLHPRTPTDGSWRTNRATAVLTGTQSTHGTTYTRGTGRTSWESQHSGEARTPNVQAPHPHQTAAMHASSGDLSSDCFYNWTGSTVDTQCSLGVDLLTPCGLPQCTPITLNANESQHVSGSSSQLDQEQAILYSNLLNDSFCDSSPYSHPTYDDIFSIYHSTAGPDTIATQEGFRNGVVSPPARTADNETFNTQLLACATMSEYDCADTQL